MIKKYILVVLAMIGVLACEDLLEVPDISGQQTTLLAPLDGSVITENNINFNWNAVEDATSYRLQIATPNFNNAIQITLDSLVVQDSLGNVKTRIDQTLLNGNYEWRIKALNSGFETAYTTAGFSIDGDENIDLIPPNTPTLTAPADGATQDDTTVNFSWTREDVPGTAERDSIYVYTDQNLQTLEIKGLGANKTFTTTLSANTYYWVVQAFDAGGNASSDSAVFEFTIN